MKDYINKKKEMIMENLRNKTGLVLLLTSVFGMFVSIFLLEEDEENECGICPAHNFNPHIHEDIDWNDVFFNEREGIWYPKPEYMNLRFDWDLCEWVPNE